MGLAVFLLAGSGIWQMALSVGLAIGLMQITRSVHPPAGTDPLVIMLSGTATPSFLLFPVLIGVMLLLGIAVLFNNFFREQRWPSQWH
ncbi:HPP family protein [Glaciimonas sp. PAMC28666]|uniref:HPP family protein n=1 Tax=Glaciimonas sp. PAMC28666 TaxID=2807626 RepID=UPI001964C631|nr:HPP family protein [Glaciimonas sp. PAMC28666]QRX84389.1 HPP family protein [Glaciimonas sp. PAMC28666]